MGYRSGDETVVFEARILHTTEKATRLAPTSIGPDDCWCPNSVIVDQEDVGNGVFEFTVKSWWAEKNGLV